MTEKPTNWVAELGAMFSLALPVVLSELGWMVQGIVDTIMVGALGPAAIGAVALGNAAYYIPALGAFGLLLGLDTLVSQAFGRQDHEACHRWLAQGVYLLLALTLPLMLLVLGLSYGFQPCGIDLAVAGPAASYLRVLNWGTLPLLLYAGVRRYLQAVGEVHVITFTYLIANLLNWLFNWILIYGKLGFPAMGVNGAALATVLSRIFMALALLGFSWRYERRRGHPLFQNWARPVFSEIRQLIRLGLPAAGQILMEVGAWNVATLAAGWLSPVELATHQIVFNYASLTYMVPLGVSSAAAVAVGHAVGAGDAPRARRAGWLALALGTAFMLLSAIVFLAAPGPLIALYTHDAAVMVAGPPLLMLAAAFQIFDGIQTVSTGALRGLGETRIPMLANFIGYWPLGLPLGITLCFAFHWGVMGLWVGLTVALVIVAAVLLRRWMIDSLRIARLILPGKDRLFSAQ
jgi:MATE family multidrug resistance protein